MRYVLSVHYRGHVLRWREGIADVWAIVQDGYPDSIEIARQHAKRQRFTHVRFTGDWTKRTKPRGGKL